MDKYALIFEGPQSGDADTLRKLKGVFIGELNFSVEETINALNNFPLTIRESEDQAALEELLVSLIASGAKAKIEEPTNPHKAEDIPSKQQSKTIVLELDEEVPHLATEPVLNSKTPEVKEVPVLSSAQSTLLSLEDDFASDDLPNAASLTPNQASKPEIKNAPNIGGITLELADLDPEPEAPKQHISEEPELEIHFENISDGESAGSQLSFDTPVSPDKSPPTTTEAVAASPAHEATSESELTFASPSITAPAAASASAAQNTITPSAPSLIPTASNASLPALDKAPTPSIATTKPKHSKSKLNSLLIEYGPTIVVPLVVLLIGNIVFFAIWGGTHPSETSQNLSQRAPLADLIEEPAPTKAAAQPSPASYSGITAVGDFSVEWKLTSLNEEILSVALKITPPIPPDLSAKDVVAGKKPPIKVTSIDIDDLPLIKVGRLAASATGPARIALIDDSRALRAIAQTQFSVEYKPDTKKLSADIYLSTEGADDSPLRWVAERGENSRAKIKLRLTF